MELSPMWEDSSARVAKTLDESRSPWVTGGSPMCDSWDTIGYVARMMLLSGRTMVNTSFFLFMIQHVHKIDV